MEQDHNTYTFSLSHVSDDTLIFFEGFLSWSGREQSKPVGIDFGGGYIESKLSEHARRGDRFAEIMYKLLKTCQVFQFHDTSSTVKIRNQGYNNDNEFLRSNAGNPAAFLYVLKIKPEWDKYYRRIVRHIQIAIPQFGDFILNPSDFLQTVPLDNELKKIWQEYEDSNQVPVQSIAA